MLPILLPLALYTTTAKVAPKVESPAAKARRMKWFTDARFGMFIHWGLYSQAEGAWKGKDYGGAGEWLLNNAQIPPADYEALRPTFNPRLFDADKWVKVAKDAGMKYIVITSKHHEGFAMWPSKVGDWNIGNTPFQRDPLKELAVACKKAGLKLCFYHSIMDWHHPDYLPHRSWDKRTGMRSDMDEYVKYMKAQLKEILTNYGPIGIIWFDGQWEGTWNHERGKDLEAYVRSLQPNVIINNRVDSGNGRGNEPEAGDYGTPEQTIPANGLPGQYWESCMTMNDTWGFVKSDHNWKSVETLVRNVIDCASKGGNYLLNVGPTGLGEIPDASIARLALVGKWMKKNGEAVYGTTAGPFIKPQPWGRVTRKGKTLFLHVLEKGARRIELAGLSADIASIHPLGGGTALTFRQSPAGVTVYLPKTDELIPVYAMELRGEPTVTTLVAKQNADGSIALLADDADLTGGVQLESNAHNLGYWVNQSDAASWTFEVTKPGTMKVVAEIACEKGTEGSTIAVEANGKRATAVIPSTGTWKDYVTLDLGTLELSKAGKVTVKVHALTKPGYAVMNLRQVRLTPR